VLPRCMWTFPLPCVGMEGTACKHDLDHLCVFVVRFPNFISLPLRSVLYSMLQFMFYGQYLHDIESMVQA
jgi:hypothetical protein